MDYLSNKTVSANKATVVKDWVVIDAQSAVLGRLSSEVAKLLRGKHKPSFTPNVDCGDKVIVINAENIALTGNKWNAKEYIRYTGYPGGQRRVVAKDMKADHPVRLVEFAVKGMLPKNRLGRQILKNLYVYPGAEHPHEAQEPKKIEL